MRGVFVTGTDTGCGKTAVACALARAAVRAGVRVRVVKPVETGCPDANGDRRPADAHALAHAAGDRRAISEICPYALRPAAAPEAAARCEGVRLDPERIRMAVERAADGADGVIVEGAGGLLVPLTPTLDMADLAGMLGLPLLVVARAALGTINHTRLTLEVADARRLSVAGVVVSHTRADLPEDEALNLGILEARLGGRLLGVLHHGAEDLVPPFDPRALLSPSAAC